LDEVKSLEQGHSSVVDTCHELVKYFAEKCSPAEIFATLAEFATEFDVRIVHTLLTIPQRVFKARLGSSNERHKNKAQVHKIVKKKGKGNEELTLKKIGVLDEVVQNIKSGSTFKLRRGKNY
jgi:hypothetical protein